MQWAGLQWTTVDFKKAGGGDGVGAGCSARCLRRDGTDEAHWCGSLTLEKAWSRWLGPVQVAPVKREVVTLRRVPLTATTASFKV